MGWGVPTHHTGYRESTKVTNISSNLKPNSKSLQILSKGLGKNPFEEKIRGKKCFWSVPLIMPLILIQIQKINLCFQE
jgi:hypothetical protein